MEQQIEHTGNNVMNLFILAANYLFLGAAILSQANVAFFLASVVSVLTIWNLVLQIKQKLKKDKK